MRKRVGKWEGGYIVRNGSGRLLYYIERWHHGARIHLCTGCTTLPGARAELARWEADPTGYRPGAEVAGAVHLGAELVAAYREHQGRKGLSPEWVDEVTRCLADWADELRGR